MSLRDQAEAKIRELGNELSLLKLDYQELERQLSAAQVYMRDYFAAKALPALMTDWTAAAGSKVSSTDDFGRFAVNAYAMADAMIAARGGK